MLLQFVLGEEKYVESGDVELESVWLGAFRAESTSLEIVLIQCIRLLQW